MSRDPDEVNKLTESTYKNVMEQFNPGLKNLVNLGKSYEKAVMAMTLAGKMYFEAVGKIGENAAVSPVSRELGVVLTEISEAHRKVLLEMEENFRRFHREIIAELDKKTDMDVKYMTATFKKYQMEHKMKQDYLERSQADLKKLRRKSQGKNALKYESKENECLETLTHRQMDMQKFIADGCREALLEEKRRFCFLVDKHCTFSYQLAAFHEKAKDILTDQIPNWQDKCTDITNVPDSVMSMIEGLRTPVSVTPQASPAVKRHSRNNSDAMIPPPAPPLKAQTSPLASMFNQDTAKQETVIDNSNDGSQMVRSISMATGLNNMSQRPRVRTIFPHKSGSNNTLLSFDEGDFIILLIPDERDGWLYGELEKTKQRGWFPSSYCRPYVDPVVNNSVVGNPPARSKSVANLMQQDPEDDMLLPPPDYSDTSFRRNSTKSLIQTHVPSSEYSVSQPNGISKPAFLGGGNPFATVKLRPTVTNDRSAPKI
ncbi:brain-specific angiogenesis inhibitor 1-associated protein 2-like protein 1b isoform X2 [Tachysurus vachellii]|uniref:brain-specific angiogenesis inhibitor 1-associated protein 2-like protein 1b isoform X2 n=1 Tax=Tachysurus vachellii TaxID=175792 RepID=UPI00296B21E8|nr:brain-specific angiogenesis inhibitor 1-associated protein 2-like protein 1b isoform X2 [Tachysurus vachellii]